MTKTVVILGAGLAGIPLAHYLLTKTAANVPDLRVVLVNPSNEFYWNLASVRVVIPGKLTEDQYMWPIPKLFSKYPSDKFEFVLGKAETLSPDTNSVVVVLSDGSRRNIDYHTVVVATGSDAKEDMPWKPLGSSQQTRAAVAKLQEEIKNAKSIVVGGAGTTGVEFAGELGSEYSKTGKKTITLIAAGSLPLEDQIMKSTREAAKDQLEKLKVKVITDTKVTDITQSGGKQILELTKSDGSKTTIETDLFVPTYGMTINTQFAPANMLAANGQVNQDTFLRSPKYSNVFIVGDAGNLESMQGIHVESQLRHLTKQFQTYLETGKIEQYKPDNKVMVGISIGPGGGTGQMGTIKPLSLLVWFLKSRYLGIQVAPEYAAGLKGFRGKW
ncbi:hypothetical protein BKA67DRAFT_559490 [Truncatella angustata]|uniref:FAD/NAD(P)-binding domain-containing protein n=1 Tax=Truncatella angustata TaxID=152316 RepID=A0A9P8ZZK1_9PEZI|nr:uncharacterized protein BKA67DRAFT_559490 [Truncatella angustata]KAH6655104.1 hypothetical protein BKA67DRAFT_559490 [Truncatella angustata]KAH8198224.1 hypothetical protein TruAng_007608 [Truncatella angustata]